MIKNYFFTIEKSILSILENEKDEKAMICHYISKKRQIIH
jgi:hypothetical protein